MFSTRIKNQSLKSPSRSRPTTTHHTSYHYSLCCHPSQPRHACILSLSWPTTTCILVIITHCVIIPPNHDMYISDSTYWLLSWPTTTGCRWYISVIRGRRHFSYCCISPLQLDAITYVEGYSPNHIESDGILHRYISNHQHALG